jgi:hypothetical protein
VSIICEYHSIEEVPKLLRSCSKPHLSSLFLRELAQSVARWPSECTNAEHAHPRAARGFSDSRWVSCSPLKSKKCSLFKAITMYQCILFARGKTGKVKNDAMPPKVGRVASDGKRVFQPSQNDSPLSQNMDEPWAYVPELFLKSARTFTYMTHASAKKWMNLEPNYHQMRLLSLGNSVNVSQQFGSKTKIFGAAIRYICSMIMS